MVMFLVQYSVKPTKSRPFFGGRKGQKMDGNPMAMVIQSWKGKNDLDLRTEYDAAARILAGMGYEVLPWEYEQIEHNKLRAFKLGAKIPEMYLLAKAVKNLSKCDAAYFGAGWQDSRLCRCVYHVAQEYGVVTFENNNQSAS